MPSNNTPGATSGLPFATADGKPKQVTAGKPTNFQQQSTGNDSARGGNRNFVGESRRQGNAPPASMPAPTGPLRAAVPQRPISASERVAPSSLPPDGAADLSKFTAPAYRRTTGSVGSDHRPFKNLK